MILAVSLFLLFIASFLLQEMMPALIALIDAGTGGGGGAFLHHARALFLPAFFFAAVLAVPFPVMLLLAFCSGMAWDAANALIWTETSPGFGGGPILFGMLGIVMHGSRDLFVRGKWVLPILLGGACVFVLLLAEYFWINFRAGDFHFPAGFWIKTIMSSLMTTILLPAYFLVIHRCLRSEGMAGEFRQFGPR